MGDRRWIVVLFALLTFVAACGSTTPSASRSKSGSRAATTNPAATTRPAGATTTTALPPETTATPTTVTPTAAVPPDARQAPPTVQQIAAQIAGTHEVADPNEGFVGGTPVTVGDGTGGYLTAVPALRNPSADGHGSLVFFWHDQKFLGWDTNRESWNVSLRTGEADSIDATYPDYAPGEAACCPTLPPVTIAYSWSGGGLAQSSTLPAGAIVGITVR